MISNALKSASLRFQLRFSAQQLVTKPGLRSVWTLNERNAVGSEAGASQVAAGGPQWLHQHGESLSIQGLRGWICLVNHVRGFVEMFNFGRLFGLVTLSSNLTQSESSKVGLKILLGSWSAVSICFFVAIRLGPVRLPQTSRCWFSFLLSKMNNG